MNDSTTVMSMSGGNKLHVHGVCDVSRCDAENNGSVGDMVCVKQAGVNCAVIEWVKCSRYYTEMVRMCIENDQG